LELREPLSDEVVARAGERRASQGKRRIMRVVNTTVGIVEPLPRRAPRGDNHPAYNVATTRVAEAAQSPDLDEAEIGQRFDAMVPQSAVNMLGAAQSDRNFYGMARSEEGAMSIVNEGVGGR